MQITGKNLADAVSDICQTYGFGYRVTLNDGNIVFALYAGSITDVTFSAEFDNLINSDYEYNGENLKMSHISQARAKGQPENGRT